MGSVTTWRPHPGSGPEVRCVILRRIPRTVRRTPGPPSSALPDYWSPSPILPLHLGGFISTEKLIMAFHPFQISVIINWFGMFLELIIDF